MPREVKNIKDTESGQKDPFNTKGIHTQAVIPFRSGYITVIGEPNVGKSTLINHLVGQNISAVTRKPQTTRQKILGILSTEKFQAVFLDTPGLLNPSYLLHEVMIRSALNALNDADVIVVLVDATVQRKSDPWIVTEKIKEINKPVILAINKIDLISKQKLNKVLGYYRNEYKFHNILTVSALKGIGTDQLLTELTALLPVHPPLFPTDIVSDSPEKFFVGEIIREKIFDAYQEEIPYSTAVEIIEFTEREGRKDVIRAEIIVERESQKAILIGKGGKAMKEIGKKARIDIEDFLGREVFIELFVKVRSNWRNDQKLLKRFGYVP
jgi:GTP-binding protein Era